MAKDDQYARSKASALLETVPVAIPAVLIPILEVFPGLPRPYRNGLILVAAVVVLFSLFRVSRRTRDLASAHRDIKDLREQLEKAEPEKLLRFIASQLFAEGAWRLSVYRKQHDPREASGDYLQKLAIIASDGDQEALAAARIAILPGTMFEFSFRANLADPRHRPAVESGPGPEEVHSAAWYRWRDDIFGSGAHSTDRSTFRPRKVAWYAAQDPSTQSICVVIVESSEPTGILFENFDQNLTAAWMFFVARAAELRDGAHEP